jgi:hypothetical protein
MVSSSAESFVAMPWASPRSLAAFSEATFLVLEARDVALARREREALRQEEVAREARGHLHDLAALAELDDVALENHVQCLAHVRPLSCPSW